MNLLDKFAKVEIKADSRISEDDKKFCEAHQSAYDEARATLQELKFCWETILESQKKLLQPVGETTCSLYLSDYSDFSISVRDIEKQLQKSHSTLIRKIVWHFNETYSISIDTGDIQDVLLPKAPQNRWDDDYAGAYEKYQDQMLHMSLNYQQIVEQIFVQMDGRGLWEQAEYYIKTQCHEGAWRFGKPKFERKKAAIQFSNAVNYDFSLPESTKNVIRGLVHFETGKIGTIPNEFLPILNPYKLPYDSFEFEDCKRVKKIRAFRNGRLDIRFSEEAHAVGFIEIYLGSLP